MSTLAGATILLTRTREDCQEWAQQLRARGAVPIVFPCIECRSIDTPALRARLAEALAAADWLAFTSQRGVSAFAALHRQPLAPRTQIAVVGPATAEAARAAYGRVDLIGAGGTAAALAASLAGRIAPASAATQVVIAVAANAGDALERSLAPLSVDCTRLDVYRTVPLAPRSPKRALASLGADNIFFASPSAVAGFVNRVAAAGGAAIYTIGPSTSEAARSAGLAVTAEARRPSLQGLVEAMQCAN